MAIYVRQSTATTVLIGPAVDETDGFTFENALTISQADIRLSKNGGAFAQSNNAAGATFMENGMYSVPLDTTDTNTIGLLTLVIPESGMRPFRLDIIVLDEAVYDVLFGTAAPLVAGTNTGTTSFSNGVNITGGSNGDALVLLATTSGHGLKTTGVGSSKHGINAAGNATNGSGISAVGNGSGHGLLLTAGATGNGLTTSVTAGAGMAISGGSSSGNGITITTTSGTGISVDTLTVSGATTLTGAVTASNASNNIVGIDVAKISGDATAADNLETAFDDTAGAVPWTGIIDQGTAQSATSTTVVLRAASAFGNDTLIGKTIAVLGSTQGYWQTRTIRDSVLSTDTVTVEAWDVTPTGTITYKIWQSAGAADDVLDNADGIETGVTPRQALRAMASVLCGRCSGAGTGTEIYVGIGVSTARVTSEIDDEGNRSLITLNL